MRRPHGTGSIAHYNGYWWAIVTLAGGKRRRRRRSTREDAEKALDELLVEYADQLGYFYSMPRRFRSGERGPRPRQGVTIRVRFDVFERDHFTCQYCGHAAPQVKLVIDHRIPVTAGGTDDPDNLVTACQACNAGKAGRVAPRLLAV